MFWSFVYLALCRLLQLVVLLCRSERSRDTSPRSRFRTGELHLGALLQGGVHPLEATLRLLKPAAEERN